jgi:NADH:ubiquinone oxidoreductase subunit 4 (subunit M)
MLLAGIVMKLGAYGALRVACNLFPLGFHAWSKWIAILGVIGIVYAAGVALRQTDLKFVIGYSVSVTWVSSYSDWRLRMCSVFQARFCKCSPTA